MTYEHVYRTASVSQVHIGPSLPHALVPKQNPKLTKMRKNSAAFESLSVKKIKALKGKQRQHRCCLISITSKSLIHSLYTTVVEDSEWSKCLYRREQYYHVSHNNVHAY